MLINNVTFVENVHIFKEDLVKLYGCSVGNDTEIGAFVEI